MKKLYCFIAFLLPFASFAQCPTGNIFLGSQDDVNSFPSNYPGCVTLPENLFIIGGDEATDISDLSPLAVLTSVGAGIIIQNVGALTTLNGLQNITSIGTEIELYSNPVLTDITALSQITDVPGRLSVDANDALTTLFGLHNIKSVGNDLNISGNTALTTMSSLTVTSVGDDIRVEYNPLLTDLLGLQNVVTLGDELAISGNDALTSLQALSGFTIMNGDLEISYNPLLTSLAGLENITTYADGLIILGNASLSDLSLLSDLTEIGGTLRIGESPLITDLKALENITTVGGLYIDGNTALTTLSDLNLTSALAITIENNDLLTDLKGLENITTLEESLAIIDNDGLTNLNDLAGLTGLGSLIIANNIALNNIQALSKITSLPGFFGLQIVLNSALTDLQGLENITTISGQVLILQNEGLTSLNGLNGLKTIDWIDINGPGLIILGNPDLAGISDLSALTTLNGGFAIAENDVLVSLAGLNNVESLGPLSFVYIGSNPLLTSLAGIGKFESVDVLVILDNASLTDLSGLEILDTVAGSLDILGNSALTSLKGLNKLTTIGGRLTLDLNPVISNLNELSSLNSLQALTITNNENLTTCAVAGICAFLKNSNPEDVTIADNSMGCNSQEEVEVSCGKLPVTLVDFKARKQEHFVQLIWSTSSEVNSSHFDIQHSHNAGQSWETLGQVQSSGESSEAKNYEFIHLNPSKGENLYRLKMVDLAASRRDETFAFSTIRSVNIDQPNEFSVYPNPVADQLIVEASGANTAGKLRIYNAAGKMLLSKDVKFSGQPYQVETSALPTGIYTIQVLSGTGSKQVQKFVKLGH